MKTNNKGYSMVEMIIVIAIIAVLGTLGMLTMNIVYTAKANSAVNSLKTQFSTLKTMTEAQSPKTAMRLYYDTAKKMYYAEYGTYDADSSTFTAYTDAATKKVVAFPDRVAIYYTDATGTERIIGEQDASNQTSVLVMYNKADGSMLLGAGSYRIAKSNNTKVLAAVNAGSTDVGETVDTIKLNKNNGSISR